MFLVLLFNLLFLIVKDLFRAVPFVHGHLRAEVGDVPAFFNRFFVLDLFYCVPIGGDIICIFIIII